MSIFGKYIYGVIESQHDCRFGAIGLQGEEVLTIGHNGLAMIISHYESTRERHVRSSRKNLLAHQRVLEHIMQAHTVLPMKFGSLASNEIEIRNLLLKHETQFQKTLYALENKVELSVKVMWKDMRSVYNEVLQENPAIQNLKIQIGENGHPHHLIEIGKMVEEALVVKKQTEAEVIFRKLSSVVVDAKMNQLAGDNMLLNGAFLVSKSREFEFDNLVEELASELEERYSFKYIGALAPYSFVDINIHSEFWET